MDIYTINEICDKYKISRVTFRSWVKQGLKIVKINRMVRIRQEDLEEFINNMKV